MLDHICRAMIDADSELSAIGHSRTPDKAACVQAAERLRFWVPKLRHLLNEIRDIETEAREDLADAPMDSVAFGNADGRIETCVKIIHLLTDD